MRTCRLTSDAPTLIATPVRDVSRHGAAGRDIKKGQIALE